MNGISSLIAVENGIGSLLCDPDGCLSYVVVLLNILTVFYLIFSSYWRMTPRLKVVGYVWAAVVVCVTVLIVAMHTCIFTLLCAVFSALSIIAVLSGIFNNGYRYSSTDEQPQTAVNAKKGCYVVFRTDDGMFAFSLYNKRKKELATSIYKYDTLEQAKAAIQVCRENGEFVEIEDTTGKWILSVKHPKLRVCARNSAFVIEYALKEGLTVMKTSTLQDAGAAVKQAQAIKECLTSIDVYFAGDEKRKSADFQKATYETAEAIMTETANNVDTTENSVDCPAVDRNAPVIDEVRPVDIFEGLSLIESFELMKPTKIIFNKEYVSKYLSAKYGDQIAISVKKSGAANLAFADAYSIVLGKRLKCFAMSYEKNNCGMLLLIRSDEVFITQLEKVHQNVNKSAAPKSQTRDWYSIVIDESFSKDEVESILDYAIAYVQAN
jgi:predicted DNA-binding protein (MmcQ/YjbR family)